MPNYYNDLLQYMNINLHPWFGQVMLIHYNDDFQFNCFTIYGKHYIELNLKFENWSTHLLILCHVLSITPIGSLFFFCNSSLALQIKIQILQQYHILIQVMMNDDTKESKFWIYTNSLTSIYCNTMLFYGALLLMTNHLFVSIFLMSWYLT